MKQLEDIKWSLTQIFFLIIQNPLTIFAISIGLWSIVLFGEISKISSEPIIFYCLLFAIFLSTVWVVLAVYRLGEHVIPIIKKKSHLEQTLNRLSVGQLIFVLRFVHMGIQTYKIDSKQNEIALILYSKGLITINQINSSGHVVTINNATYNHIEKNFERLSKGLLPVIEELNDKHVPL